MGLNESWVREVVAILADHLVVVIPLEQASEEVKAMLERAGAKIAEAEGPEALNMPLHCAEDERHAPYRSEG